MFAGYTYILAFVLSIYHFIMITFTGAVKLQFPESFLIDCESKIKRWFQTANGRKVNESQAHKFDD